MDENKKSLQDLSTRAIGYLEYAKHKKKRCKPICFYTPLIPANTRVEVEQTTNIVENVTTQDLH